MNHFYQSQHLDPIIRVLFKLVWILYDWSESYMIGLNPVCFRVYRG